MYLLSSLRPFTISLLQEVNSCIPSEIYRIRIVSSFRTMKIFRDNLFNFNSSFQNDLCLPGSWMKLPNANKERALSSVSLADLNIDMKRLIKHRRAAPRIPVSGRTLSRCTSHVADTKHAEHNSAILLFRPSAKASKSRPNSWLDKTNAIFLSHLSAAFSSSF